MSLVKLQDFCDNNNVSINNFYVQKSNGSLPDNCIVRDGKAVYVNEKVIIRYKNFQKMVRNFNQDMLYYLTDDISESELARQAAKQYGGTYHTYMSHFGRGMFYLAEKSIINTQVNKMDWKLFKFFRSILYRMSKVDGYRTDVSAVLDYKTEEYERQRIRDD